jgi:2-desacetyl-2-hydroxyethyl bacteriochlorophyllide A dehydrogenase
MIKQIINKPKLRNFIDSLPENNRLVRFLRIVSKFLVFRKTIHFETKLLFPGISDVVLEKRAILGPGRDEVLIRTLFTAVSPGTERSYFLDLPNFHQERPYVPGYSGAGVVIKLARKISGIKKGDLVAGILKHSTVNVIIDDELVRVPAGVSPRDASFVTLGVIALTGIRRAALTGGEKVAVLGQGVLGQLVDQLVRIQGAGSVTAVALSDAKKAMAEKNGVDEFIALAKRDSSFPEFNFDIVIDITGSLKGFESVLKMVKSGGRVVMLGSIPTYAEASNWVEVVVEKGIEVRGAHVRNLEAEGLTYKEEAERFLRLLAEGKIRVEHLITDVYEPEKAPEIYKRLAAGDRDMVGVVIDWQGAKRIEQSA